MIPVEKIWKSFVKEYGENDWGPFANTGATVAERLRRFDWLMMRHQREESSWEARP